LAAWNSERNSRTKKTLPFAASSLTPSEEDLAELKRVQAERAFQPREILRPFTHPSAHAPATSPTSTKPFGFDFSTRFRLNARATPPAAFGPSIQPFGDLFDSETSGESAPASEELAPLDTLPRPDAA
jgi:hypothetical protein